MYFSLHTYVYFEGSVEALIAVQTKQMWYVGNATMTVISVAVGIRNLSHYILNLN